MENKLKAGENNPLTEKEIIAVQRKAEAAYGKFLTALGYDWANDDNMRDTPKRVAKMYVRETAFGAYTAQPKITAFDNATKYDGMVFEGNIDVKSLCSHHFMGFYGKAHVAYLPNPNGKICGLSKLNRVVEWFARRPQLQEHLTQQIHDYLSELLPGNGGIAVVIKAGHTCVSARGVNQDSTMITNKLSGAFMEVHGAPRNEFFDNIKMLG